MSKRSPVKFPRLLLLLSWYALAYGDGLEETVAATPEYAVEIHKSEQTLLIKRGDTVTRKFHVALGNGGPGDKRRTGDRKTPEGVYRISGFNDTSKFHIFMRLNYPNIKDAFYGLKDHRIDRNEFTRIATALKSGDLPPQNTALGGSIGIHGLGTETAETLKIHRNLNWTQGCIALTNREVNELRQYVAVGTKVVIKE